MHLTCRAASASDRHELLDCVLGTRELVEEPVRFRGRLQELVGVHKHDGHCLDEALGKLMCVVANLGLSGSDEISCRKDRAPCFEPIVL